MPFANTGSQTDTPFAYYVSGIPVYPQNGIYEVARQALSERNGRCLAVVLQERIKRGLVAGSVSVLPESWWNQFLLNYVAYFANNFSHPEELEDQAAAAIEIMVSASPSEAWPKLVDFIVRKADILSGWTKSWNRQIAESQQITRGEDGNYYCDDLDGIRVQVSGARSLPETHLDFVTQQILSGYGCLRQIFNVFATFAIAHEYRLNPSNFPRSMKAIVNSTFQTTSHSWQLMQFQRTRSIRWRPPSNFCDPEWLAADLLGHFTDTLDKDSWKDRVEKQKGRPNKLDDECSLQMDYVLDSGVSIGDEEEVYLTFEGRRFRWVNGTIESKATISIGYKDRSSHRMEDESLNRLLSALVWQHGQPIVKGHGVGGPKRAIPHIWAPRSNMGLRVDPQYCLFDSDKSSSDRWLALALHKEGVNSNSVFYKFFSFWKMIEVAIKPKKDRVAWIDKTSPRLVAERERVREISKQNASLAAYLDDSCRNAIAHVFRHPIVNPDDYSDYLRISQDVHVVEVLARMAVEEYLPELI